MIRNPQNEWVSELIEEISEYSKERREMDDNKDKSYTSISKVDDSQNFSYAKTLLEMMDQKKIKPKMSVDEITEGMGRNKRTRAKKVIPKVKSQNMKVIRQEITNEEYFDLIDEEKGTKQTKLNDIFKNFRTKKIEEKEELMDFPFAISEEEDSQDESGMKGNKVLSNMNILKTESYHVISSTSSFRSGNASRFRKKMKSPKKLDTGNEIKTISLAGRDNNSSVYSTTIIVSPC